MTNQKVVHESEDAAEINTLWNSKEWSKPEWSERKGLYIMIRKVRELK